MDELKAKIEETRKKLDDIMDSGLDQKEALKLSQELDALIEKYMNLEASK